MAPELLADAVEPDAAGREGGGFARHVVSVGASAAAQLDLVAPAFRDALARGRRCLFIADRTAPEAFRREMADRDCDLADPLASGQFQLLTAEETYTRGGYFDADRMLGLIHQSASGARDAAFSGWCGVGEVTWFARGVPGADRLLEYEYRLNELAGVESAEVICLYDAGTMPGWLCEELKKVHPLLHANGPVTRSETFAAGPVQAADVPLVDELEPPADQLSCSRLAELLSAYVDGQVAAVRWGPVGKHLSACRSCSERVASYRALKEGLSSLRRPADIGPGFWDAVRTRLAEVPESPE